MPENEDAKNQTPEVPVQYRIGYDWGKLEHELEVWGEKLVEVRQQATTVGEDLLRDIEQRYEDVRAQTIVLKKRSEEQAAELEKKSKGFAETMAEKAKVTQDALKKHSEEFSGQAKVASDRMSTAAGEVGEGFSRAWDDLGKAFHSAYEKMKG